MLLLLWHILLKQRKANLITVFFVSNESLSCKHPQNVGYLSIPMLVETSDSGLPKVA